MSFLSFISLVLFFIPAPNGEKAPTKKIRRTSKPSNYGFAEDTLPLIPAPTDQDELLASTALVAPPKIFEKSSPLLVLATNQAHLPTDTAKIPRPADTAAPLTSTFVQLAE